jgi:hypothetical protein
MRPLKNLLGINCHQWDVASHPQQTGKEARTTALQNAIISTSFSWLRIYTDATVIKDGSNLTFMFSPDGRGYMQDEAIAQLKKSNPSLKVNICYQNAPKNIQAEWTGKKNTQYRHVNSDPSKPEAWAELAADMAVIAARGGTNTNVADYPLFTSPNWWDPKQIMLKGSGLYDQVEAQNELDNNWSNDQFLNGSQYAVLWKVVYDAVKKVDPNISVSSTGVMTENPQVLTDALNYSKSQGWGKIFDKYQFHCYPWGWSKDIASALPPEMNMIPAAKKVVAAAGGIPCIIGEWGFDLHPDSDMGVRPFGPYTGEEIRSYWICRSLLGFLMAGIDTAFYYREYQDYGLKNDTNATIFETSSLFIKDDQDVITRRLSGDVFKQLSGFGDFSFDAAIVDNDVQKVYRFTNGTKQLYAGWTIEKVSLVTVPNGSYTTNRAVFTEVKSNYNFPAGTRLDLQPGDSMQQTAFAGGTIELSTKPVFVLVDGATPPTPPPPPPPTPKEIYHRGYWTINNRRVYYVNYTDGTWTLTNGKYVPL